MFLTVSLQNQKIALGWAWMGIKWLELCNLCFFSVQTFTISSFTFEIDREMV